MEKQITFTLISILYVGKNPDSKKENYFKVKGMTLKNKFVRFNICDLDLLNQIIVESLNNNGITSVIKRTDNKKTYYC